MRHIIPSGLILALLASVQMAIVRAQAPAAAAERRAFEVATVKPNKSGEMRVSMRIIPGGAYEAFNVTLGAMIRQAYRLQDFQLIGAPAWVDQDRFDIVGKVPAGEPLDLPARLQSLVLERFNLKAREETREAPIYALIVANQSGKLGSKLTPSTQDCTPAARGRGNAPSPPPPTGPPPPGTRPACGITLGGGRIMAGGQSMAQLANTLSQFSGRIVVDRTGLSGLYDVDLEFTPDPGLRGRGPGGGLPPAPGGDRVVDPAGVAIFTAIQEQLGLKLDSQRGPVPVLVVESVSQPTEN
jgi:uncharacterized protein (TIGR03435 family)